MRLIDADAFEELFYRQLGLGATDVIDAVEDALQDTPTVCVASMLSLNGLRDAAYTDALYHGLWREGDTLLDGAQMIRAEAMELRRLGHEAYSCDVQPCSGGRDVCRQACEGKPPARHSPALPARWPNNGQDKQKEMIK